MPGQFNGANLKQGLITAAPMFNAMAAGYSSGRGPYAYMDQGAAMMQQQLKMKRDQEAAAAAAAAFAGLVPGGLGMASRGGGSVAGTWTPAPPPPKPTKMHMGMPDVASGGLSFGGPKVGGGDRGLDFGSAVMTPQEMLIEGARRRGYDPVDVATAISYETGGTFNPTIRGPTTQWGTHDGLIQFGDPQGEKYGLDLSSPDAAWRSQLDPDSGAVWKYLEDTGVRPGMGLPEIYSAINAGAVGRMGASDANNGGAPGTVADKVASMGPHREKAASFLGGTWTPNASTTMSAKGETGGGYSTGAPVDPMADPYVQQLMQVMAMPGLTPEQQAVVQLQLQSRMEMLTTPQPGAEEEAARAARARDADFLGLERGSPEWRQYVVTGEMPEAPKPGYTRMTPEQVATILGLDPAKAYQVSPEGKIEAIGGSLVTVDMGEDAGQYLYGTEAGLPPGWRIHKETGVASQIPGGPAAIEADALAGKKDRTATQGKLKLGTSLENINLNIKEIEDGGLPVTGVVGDARRTWLGRMVTGDGAVDFKNRSDQVTDSAALAEIQNMRDNSPTGGAVGALTDGERIAIGNAVTALNASTSKEEYARAAKVYRQLALDIAYGEGAWEMLEDGSVVPKGGAAPAVGGDLGLTDDDLQYLGQP